MKARQEENDLNRAFLEERGELVHGRPKHAWNQWFSPAKDKGGGVRRSRSLLYRGGKFGIGLQGEDGHRSRIRGGSTTTLLKEYDVSKRVS